MLTDLTDSFRPILREKDQKFVLNLSQAPTEIFADQIRLTQVVSNLVTNASKYSGEGSEVKIIATSDNDDIVITVEDQGIGIESFDLDHVFGAFFRSDNEGTRAQSGTGIGLYFCRMIVEYHNGDIAAESENGKGTTVTLRMPREYSSELQEETALAA